MLGQSLAPKFSPEEHLKDKPHTTIEAVRKIMQDQVSIFFDPNRAQEATKHLPPPAARKIKKYVTSLREEIKRGSISYLKINEITENIVKNYTLSETLVNNNPELKMMADDGWLERTAKGYKFVPQIQKIMAERVAETIKDQIKREKVKEIAQGVLEKFNPHTCSYVIAAGADPEGYSRIFVQALFESLRELEELLPKEQRRADMPPVVTVDFGEQNFEENIENSDLESDTEDSPALILDIEKTQKNLSSFINNTSSELQKKTGISLTDEEKQVLTAEQMLLSPEQTKEQELRNTPSIIPTPPKPF